MAKAKTTPAAFVAPARIAEVGTEINKAGQAAASMLEHVRTAAKLAADQLNPAKPLKERVEEVMALYAADFKAVDHNVKALFGDALLLAACGQEPVTVSAGKNEIHTTAVAAVDASKHVMRAAASEVRQAHGMGRKAGGGRKASAAKASAAEAAVGAAPDVVKASDVDRFSEWLDALPDYVSDEIFHAKIVAALIQAGWTLTKATKGRKIQGVASN